MAPTEFSRASKARAATAEDGVPASTRAENASRAASRNRTSTSGRFIVHGLLVSSPLILTGSRESLPPLSPPASPATFESAREGYPPNLNFDRTSIHWFNAVGTVTLHQRRIAPCRTGRASNCLPESTGRSKITEFDLRRI